MPKPEETWLHRWLHSWRQIPPYRNQTIQALIF